MIDLGRLSYEEKEAIEELRMRVETALEPDMLEDLTLLYRFLKARDFDVDKAEKMLRKNISWKKANQISTILQDFKPREFYRKYIDPIFLGRDKVGDILVYAVVGKMEGREVLKCVTMNEYMKHWVWFAERRIAAVRELIEKGGKTGTQISFIADLEQLTIGNATYKASIEICIRILHIFQDNYPEGVKCMYIINAPSYYVFAFSILRTMMSNATLQKFLIFGRNGWKEKLLEKIDAHVLPAFLGGNRNDSDLDSLFKTLESWTGKMPSHYHLLKEDRYFKDKTRVTKILVPQFGTKVVYIKVEENESVIQWEFLVKSKDIGFGLFFEKSEELVELLPVQRYDTVDGIEIGSYRAKCTGKYVIMFDNSYSWLNSKEIEYSVKVITPGR